MKIIVGTRGSELALTQTNLVVDRIRNIADVSIEIKRIKTRGDRIKTALFDGIGFFVKELNEAVEDERVDIAVHSMKDLPTEIPKSLRLNVTERISPYEALVSTYESIEELPRRAMVGTSSLRRRAELRKLRNDLRVMDLRGNLDTRLSRLDKGDFDAIVVAEAGLIRLGMEDRISKILSIDEIMPPAGQGALGIISRKDDKEIFKILSLIEDDKARAEVMAERSFLDRLRGGCQIPAGVLARIDGKRIKMSAVVSSLDGRKYIRKDLEGSASDPIQLGEIMAKNLLDKGGREILVEIRN